MGSPASSEESGSFSEETEKPGRPATPVNFNEPVSPSPEDDEEIFDDANEHPAETNAAETTSEAESPAATVSIPTIEVSNDNDGNSKAENGS